MESPNPYIPLSYSKPILPSSKDNDSTASLRYLKTLGQSTILAWIQHIPYLKAPTIYSIPGLVQSIAYVRLPKAFA